MSHTHEEEEKKQEKSQGTGCLWGLILILILGVILGGPMAVVGSYTNSLSIDPSLSITNIDTVQNNTYNNTYIPAATIAPAVLPLSGTQNGECVYAGGTYQGGDKFVRYVDPNKPSGYGYAYINQAGVRIETGPPLFDITTCN